MINQAQLTKSRDPPRDRSSQDTDYTLHREHYACRVDDNDRPRLWLADSCRLDARSRARSLPRYSYVWVRLMRSSVFPCRAESAKHPDPRGRVGQRKEFIWYHRTASSRSYRLVINFSPARWGWFGDCTAIRPLDSEIYSEFAHWKCADTLISRIKYNIFTCGWWVSYFNCFYR